MSQHNTKTQRIKSCISNLFLPVDSMNQSTLALTAPESEEKQEICYPRQDISAASPAQTTRKVDVIVLSATSTTTPGEVSTLKQDRKRALGIFSPYFCDLEVVGSVWQNEGWEFDLAFLSTLQKFSSFKRLYFMCYQYESQ